MKHIIFRISSVVAACLLLASCGAILEEAAEQALEEGGLDVEVDDIESGDITVNVENEDGEESTIVFDGDQGTVEFDSEDGQATIGVDTGLAEGWPDEFPLPDDAIVNGSLADRNAERSFFNASFSGPFGSIESYLEHFRTLSPPILSESDFTGSDSQQYTIMWGTEEQPLANLLLFEADGELNGQISIEIPN